jgi:hypothetical protein
LAALFLLSLNYRNYSAHVKILLFNRDKQDKWDNIKIMSLFRKPLTFLNLKAFILSILFIPVKMFLF